MFFKQKILKVYLFRKKHAICVNKDETLCLGKHLYYIKGGGVRHFIVVPIRPAARCAPSLCRLLQGRILFLGWP